MKVTKFKKALVSFIFPSKCSCCGEIIQSGYVCEKCKSQLKFVEEKRCLSCGMGNKFCECKFNVYRFDGIVAPFYNADAAQQGIYGAKFGGRISAYKFYVNEMTKCVKDYFGNIKFDAVTFVPTSRKRLRERGYNQSEILAKGIAENLNLPVYDLLKVKNKSIKQHQIERLKDRFKNVKELYDLKGRARFENLLLVDDIKTTGATLDQCSRCLKLGGAEKVYCVTALVAESGLKKTKNQV